MRDAEVWLFLFSPSLLLFAPWIGADIEEIKGYSTLAQKSLPLWLLAMGIIAILLTDGFALFFMPLLLPYWLVGTILIVLSKKAAILYKVR